MHYKKITLTIESDKPIRSVPLEAVEATVQILYGEQSINASEFECEKIDLYDVVVDGVCEQFDINKEALFGARGTEKVAIARLICMALIYEISFEVGGVMGCESYDKIAGYFERERTMMYYAFKKIGELRATQPYSKARIQAVKDKVMKITVDNERARLCPA